jgi:hypothetical protein
MFGSSKSANEPDTSYAPLGDGDSVLNARR